MSGTLTPYMQQMMTRGANAVLWLAVCCVLGGLGLGAEQLFIEGRPSVGLLLLAAALIAYGVWQGLKSIAEKRDLTKHPMYAELARHGDLTEVCRQIETVARSAGQGQATNCVVADGWLVRPDLMLEFARCSEIVWAYVKETDVRVQGVAVGKLRSVLIHTHAGPFSGLKALEVSVLESEVPALFEKIRLQAPSVVIGYDAALAQRWRENPARTAAELRKRGG